MKKAFIVLLISILLSGCQFSNKYQNRESDKQDAEEIAFTLFENIKLRNFEKTTSLFGQKFFEVTTKEELLKIFEVTDRELGLLKSIELIDWSTDVSEGAIEKGIYILNYKCKFEKGKVDLRIVLIKEENGEIKVVGYNVINNLQLE